MTTPTPSYPNGCGPATESAIATADRMLTGIAEIEAAHAAKIRSMLAPAKPEQLPLALTDASDVFGDDEPAWMVERDAAADAAMRTLGMDPDTLAEREPVNYIALVVAFRVGAAKAETERAPYVAQPNAGKAIRASLHATGVKVPR